MLRAHKARYVAPAAIPAGDWVTGTKLAEMADRARQALSLAKRALVGSCVKQSPADAKHETVRHTG